MKKYYKDFYGSTASIEEIHRGDAIYFLLKTCCSNGINRERKHYKTFRGARIALGRTSDCWNEVKTIN